MKPESQDIRTEMCGFAHKYGWDVAIMAYRNELESEDLWECLDYDIIKLIFQNTFDEGHRNRALSILIASEIDLYEAIDLFYDYEFLLETEAGTNLLTYLTCLLEKMEGWEMRNLFARVFIPGQTNFLPISIRIADEIAKRDKMPPLPPSKGISPRTVRKIERHRKYRKSAPPPPFDE